MAKTVENQKLIKIGVRDFGDGKAFTRIHKEAMKQAMNDLKNDAYKLYTYLTCNKDEYELALSQKEMESWGIKKDSYYRAVDILVDKRYLVPVKEGSNIYIFYETPLPATTNSQIAKEDNSSEIAKENSQIEKSSSIFAKEISQKPQRNTINTINTINNTVASSELESPVEEFTPKEAVEEFGHLLTNRIPTGEPNVFWLNARRIKIVKEKKPFPTQ